MRQFLILLLGSIVLASCAVTNQSGTPDDQATVSVEEPLSEVSEQADCRWPHPPVEDDSPVGEARLAGEPLERGDMRLRPGFQGRLLVPEAWVVEHDGQCTNTPSIVWVNPVDGRERVAHRMGMTRTDTRTPLHDPTSDIHDYLTWFDAAHTDGQTVRVTEIHECNYDFEVDTTDGYLLAGRWLDLGEVYAISSVTVGTGTEMVQEHRASMKPAFDWEPGAFLNRLNFFGPSYCQSFAEFVAGGTAPRGSNMDYRPGGWEPWNSELDNTCLRHLDGDFPERITFDDGVWMGGEDDIIDPRANRRFWRLPAGDAHSTHARISGVAYADLVPETSGTPVLEVVVGVVCNAQAGIHEDVQVLRSTGSGWERIGLPIDGYLYELSATASGSDATGEPSLGRERLHISRPSILGADDEYADDVTLCCVTGRYANTIEWSNGSWTPVETADDQTDLKRVREAAVFESLIQVNPALEDCHYSDIGHYMPAPFRQDGGDNVSMSCDFRLDGLLPLFDYEIKYPLRVAAGVADPVDDHVRAVVKKHLDRRLAEDLPEAHYYGPGYTGLPSILYVAGEVAYQSESLYSVGITTDYMAPGMANMDHAFDGVTVFKPTGEKLDLADLFDPSTDWLPRLIEIYDEAGQLTYPRCGRWATDESGPETAFLGFVVTPTALHLYNYLSPNACGLEGVDIAYEILDDLLDPTGPLAELVGTEGE